MLRSLSHRRHAHGSAAHRGLGAQLLRRRRERQLPRRQRAQGLQPHRADRHDRGHLRPHPQGQGNRSARPLALPRRQLPLDAQRRQALRNRHPHPGHRPHPPRRPRAERLHLCRPRHRRHPLRHSLRHHRRHRRAQGPAARRRQRRRHAPAAHSSTRKAPTRSST